MNVTCHWLLYLIIFVQEYISIYNDILICIHHKETQKDVQSFLIGHLKRYLTVTLIFTHVPFCAYA